MATGTLEVTHTFVANTTASGPQVNTNFIDIVDWLNNRDDGTDEWRVLKVTGTVANPVIITGNQATTEVTIDNSAADGDPVISFELSGTSQFTMGVDDGDSDKFKIGTSAIGTNTILSVDPTNRGLTLHAAAPATPDADTLYKANIVKGWINLNGTGTATINDDFNVTSIVDNGTGDFTITWATAFNDAFYAAGSMCENTVIVLAATGHLAAGSVRINVNNLSATPTDANPITVMAIGKQS